MGNKNDVVKKKTKDCCTNEISFFREFFDKPPVAVSPRSTKKSVDIPATIGKQNRASFARTDAARGITTRRVMDCTEALSPI